MEGILFANIAAFFATIFILFLRKFLLNKVSSKVFVLLWIFVIIRLLLPFEFSSAFSIYPLFEEAKPAAAEASFVFSDQQMPVYSEITAEDFSAPVPSANKRAEISKKEAVFIIWAGGVLFFCIFTAAKHISVIKKIKANCVLFDDLPEGFENGKIRYYKSPDLCSPLSFGLLHPVVVLPEYTKPEQLPFVLIHERSHIENGDAALKFAAVFALALNWFNPFVWIMVRFFERDLELYCDERVIFAIGNEKSAFYANTILDFAERESLSFNFFSASSLKERVVSIMNNKTKQTKTPAVLIIFTAMLIIMTACGTSPRTAEEGILKSEISGEIETSENNIEPLVMDIESGEISVPYEYTVPGDFSGYRVDFTWPSEETAVITELWGYKGHTGIDIGETKGSEVYAAANGKVIKAKRGTSGYGWHIIIDHGNSVQTVYAHLSEIYPEEGQQVEKGEIIGLSGSTGNSIGSHLHFELRFGELYLNPLNHIPTPEQEGFFSNHFEVPEFIFPCENGKISSSFGGIRNHCGTDICAEAGTSVFASADGTVISAEYSKTDLGNHVIIEHKNGYQSVYANCEDIFTEIGKEVRSGEVIASVGSSGNSTGPHLHFEIIQNGENLDPEDFILK